MPNYSFDSPEDLLSLLQDDEGNQEGQQEWLNQYPFATIVAALGLKVREAKEKALKKSIKEHFQLYPQRSANYETPEAAHARFHHPLRQEALQDDLKAFETVLENINNLKRRGSPVSPGTPIPLSEKDIQIFRYYESTFPSATSPTTQLLFQEVNRKIKIGTDEKMLNPGSYEGSYKDHIKVELEKMFNERNYNFAIFGDSYDPDTKLIESIVHESPDLQNKIKHYCLSVAFDELLNKVQEETDRITQDSCCLFLRGSIPKVVRIEAIIKVARAGKEQFIKDYLVKHNVQPICNFQDYLLRQPWDINTKQDNKDQKADKEQKGQDAEQKANKEQKGQDVEQSDNKVQLDTLQLALQSRRHFTFREDHVLDAERVQSVININVYIKRPYYCSIPDWVLAKTVIPSSTSNKESSVTVSSLQPDSITTPLLG